MSKSDIPFTGRQRLLIRLRELFAKIDDAFARGDFDTARCSNREVAEVLALIESRPSRDDPSRASGIRSQHEACDETSEPSSRRAS